MLHGVNSKGLLGSLVVGGQTLDGRAETCSEAGLCVGLSQLPPNLCFLQQGGPFSIDFSGGLLQGLEFQGSADQRPSLVSLREV